MTKPIRSSSKVVGIRLPAPVVRKAREIAKPRCETVSAVLRRIILERLQPAEPPLFDDDQADAVRRLGGAR